jgi:hypothetical protein
MKATLGTTLLAAVLCQCLLAMIGDAALAQGRPEAGPGPAVPNLQGRQPERAPPPRRPDEQAPSEGVPSIQDEMPAAPGCQDQGRKLELIV